MSDTKDYIDNSDYHTVKNISNWLLLKYGMKYDTYRRKSARRKSELRAEYIIDTGNPDPRESLSHIREVEKVHKVLKEESGFDMDFPPIDVSDIEADIRDYWED